MDPATVDLSQYDTLDVGSNTGVSAKFALEKLGATGVLGVDINARQVQKLNAQGYPTILADCRDLRFPDNTFRIAVLSHVLEHLDHLGDVTSVLASMARVTKEVLLIRQPWFDDAGYLSTLGLKSVGANLTIHPLHLTLRDFTDLFWSVNIRDYAIYGSSRMKDTHHPSGWIISGVAPADTKNWKSPETVAYKPRHIMFDRPMYQELYVIVRLSPDDTAMTAAAAVPNRELLIKSAYRFAPLPD